MPESENTTERSERTPAQFVGDLKLMHGEAIYPVVSHELWEGSPFFGRISGIGIMSPSSPNSYELFEGERRIGILDIIPIFDLKIDGVGEDGIPKWTINFRGMKNDPLEATMPS